MSTESEPCFGCRARSGVSRRLFTPAVAAFPTSHRNDAGAHTTLPIVASTTACFSGAVWQDGELTLRQMKYPVDRTVAKIAELSLPTEITAALRHLLETGRPPTS